jgi:hypothetical protein
MKRLVIALVAVSLMSGCSILKKGKKPVTPTLGERIAVLSNEAAVEVDPALAATPVTLPVPLANESWTQPGGNAAKSMGHLGLGSSPAMAWRVSIGEGSSKKAGLTTPPVAAEGKIFVMDTQAVVRAISPDNGATLWRTPIRGRDIQLGHPVRRRSQLRQWPNLRDDRRRRRRRARRQDRRHRLDGAPRRPAARSADHRQRQCLCDHPGQPAVRAQSRRRLGALDRRERSRSPACSAPRRRPPRRGRSSPATRRASSPPIATRTARWSGRTRWRAPASRPL